MNYADMRTTVLRTININGGYAVPYGYLESPPDGSLLYRVLSDLRDGGYLRRVDDEEVFCPCWPADWEIWALTVGSTASMN